MGLRAQDGGDPVLAAARAAAVAGSRFLDHGQGCSLHPDHRVGAHQPESGEEEGGGHHDLFNLPDGFLVPVMITVVSPVESESG